MRKWVSLLMIGLLALVPLQYSNAANPKAGGSCSKLNSKQTYNEKVFTCTKLGKKLVWDKGRLINRVLPSPTPQASILTKVPPNANPASSEVPTAKASTEPNAPTSLNDIVTNSEGISYWAWKKASNKIKTSITKLGNIQISIGPNTLPDNPYPLVALNYVSRLTANFPEPDQVRVVYASEKDIDWGQNQITQFCDSSCGYDVNGEAKKACNVPITPCWGGLAVRNQKTGVTLIYITASDWGKNDADHTQGTLEAHEYFHTIQSVLLAPQSFSNLPRWLVEGSATWVANASTFNANFAKYQKERNRVSIDTLEHKSYSVEWLNEFLNPNSGLNWDSWNKYDNWNLYDIGSLATEALVAIQGPDSILQLMKNIGIGMNFEQSFKTTFGLSWKDGALMLAKAISKESK